MESYKSYKIKIEMPNILETVSEAFDGVLNLMTPNSVIFSGALREIIAGFDSHKLLNIIVPQNEARILTSSLKSSNKWTEKHIIDEYKQIAKIREKEVVGVALPHTTPDDDLSDNNIGFKTSSNPFSTYTTKVLNGGQVCSYRNSRYTKNIDYSDNIMTKTFVNVSNQKLQIITYKTNNLYMPDFEKETPANIASKAEFICSGLIMDAEGALYEVIEGARSDCLEKVIRINLNGNINANLLSSKIDKLVQQGWTSEINVNKIKQDIFRKKRNMDRKLARRTITKTETDDNLEITFTKHPPTDSRFSFDINIPDCYFSSKDKHLNSGIATNLFYTIVNDAHILLPNTLFIDCLQERRGLKLRLVLPNGALEKARKIKDAISLYFSRKCNLKTSRISEASKHLAKKQAPLPRSSYLDFGKIDKIVYEKIPPDKQINKPSSFSYREISTGTAQNSSGSSLYSSFEFSKEYMRSFDEKISIREEDIQEKITGPDRAPLRSNDSSPAPPLKPMKMKKQSGSAKDKYLAAAARELKATLIKECKDLNDRVTRNRNFENLSDRIVDFRTDEPDKIISSTKKQKICTSY